MEEKTIEVLKAELEAVTKDNLERELAAEKKKAEEAVREAEAKKAGEYKEQIRKEVMEEMAKESHITTGGEPEKMVANNSTLEVFLNKFKENHGLKGKTYEDSIKDLANKGGY